MFPNILEVKKMSTEQNFQEIKQRAEKISRKNDTFSNPIRVLIISVVLAKEEISWSQLKEYLEKIISIGVNPNTLSFHLAKLVEMGYLEKAGTKEQPAYKVSKAKISEITIYLDPIIVEEIKKKVL